jgi:hypothetical protein
MAAKKSTQRRGAKSGSTKSTAAKPAIKALATNKVAAKKTAPKKTAAKSAKRAPKRTAATKPARKGAAPAAVRAPSAAPKGKSPAQLIDQRIEELGDWRGKLLAQIRTLIKSAIPQVVEEWKWRGVPVWSHGGMICTGETHKKVVKMTFAKGAALDDPAGLFNSSLDGNTRRAIDFHEGAKIKEAPLKALVRAAAALNASRARR